MEFTTFADESLEINDSEHHPITLTAVEAKSLLDHLQMRGAVLSAYSGNGPNIKSFITTSESKQYKITEVYGDA